MDYLDLKLITERLKTILHETNLSNKEFCDSSGISPATFSQIINGKTQINVDTINKVVSTFGGKYSADWFVLGRGSMNNGDISANSNNFSMEIEKKNQEINLLKEKLKNIESKQVSNITVYYSDNSYMNFNPEK